jgi:hypothetical protein
MMSKPMAAGRSEMVSNHCTMDGESTSRHTMPVDIETGYPLSRLSAMLYSVWQYTTTDFLLCSTLSGDTKTDYLLCSTCRYYYRLFALATFSSALSGGILHSTILCAQISRPHYTRLSAILCLSILQPTLCSALLCQLYYNRQSYVIYSVC